MNKKKLHHYWTRWRAVKPAYFFIAALLCSGLSAVALRDNNQHMIGLRDAVYTADQDNGDVQGALGALQAYVVAHMNTNLSAGPQAVHPPIQLKYTYDRLVAAQGAAVTAHNTQIYNDAQHYCEQQNSSDFSGRNRVPCIEQYVQSHGGKLTIVPDALYKFDFIAPVWSPDVAGWSLVAAALSSLLFLISLGAAVFVKRTLKS
ncbi:MAG: hypothetical protein ABI602_01400 [Candidatus Saccharibacteria bacterium]